MGAGQIKMRFLSGLRREAVLADNTTATCTMWAA